MLLALDIRLESFSVTLFSHAFQCMWTAMKDYKKALLIVKATNCVTAWEQVMSAKKEPFADYLKISRLLTVFITCRKLATADVHLSYDVLGFTKTLSSLLSYR